MSMFSYEQINTLNESEFSVYNYVTRHLDKVKDMSIRELSAAAGVSTTTILRFCGKLGCSGYTEFRYRLRQEDEKKVGGQYLPSVDSAIQFLQSTFQDEAMLEKLGQAAGMCRNCRQVLFLGIGTSGGLGEYGARLFSNVGVAAFSITDPFYPPPARDMEDTVLVILSVSGETPMVVSLANSCKKRRMKLISITNTEACTIARMSDLNFSYYMPPNYAYRDVCVANLTTQIPVIHLLERLSHEIQFQKETENNKR